MSVDVQSLIEKLGFESSDKIEQSISLNFLLVVSMFVRIVIKVTPNQLLNLLDELILTKLEVDVSHRKLIKKYTKVELLPVK